MPIQKVIVYVTAEQQLLLFRQPESPEGGVQVPGGSVEPGESLEAAALREAQEETGLVDLRIEAFLGSARYVTRDLPRTEHERHFFHLSTARAEPKTWTYIESRPAGSKRAIPFELYWEPLATACPDWEMDAFLGSLRPQSSTG